MSSSGLIDPTSPRWNGSALPSDALAFPVFSDYARDLQLVIGNRSCTPAWPRFATCGAAVDRKMISPRSRNTSSPQIPSKTEDARPH